MGILNRVIGKARRSATTSGTGRTGRPAARGRTSAAPTSGTRGGLGGIAKRLMGGRRRGGL